MALAGYREYDAPSGGLGRGSMSGPSTTVKPKFCKADSASLDDAAEIALLPAGLQIPIVTVTAHQE